MSKKVTYKDVKAACEALQAEGTKITVRAVLAITGGSMATIMAMIRKWEEACADPGPYSLSDELQQAFRAEISQVVAGTREQDRQALERAQAGEADALAGLQAAESRVEALERDLEETQKQLKDVRAYYEKREAVSAERRQLQQETIASLEQEKAALQDAKVELSQQLAAARQSALYAARDAEAGQARIKSLEQQLAEVTASHTEQVTALRDRIEGLVKGVALAEQKLTDQAVRLEEWKTERSRIKELEEDHRHALALVREYSDQVKAAKQQIETLEGEKAALLEAVAAKDLSGGPK